MDPELRRDHTTAGLVHWGAIEIGLNGVEAALPELPFRRHRRLDRRSHPRVRIRRRLCGCGFGHWNLSAGRVERHPLLGESLFELLLKLGEQRLGPALFELGQQGLQGVHLPLLALTRVLGRCELGLQVGVVCLNSGQLAADLSGLVFQPLAFGVVLVPLSGG